ncbi:hypothetical protein HDU97_004420 [Phlyctochytrium planicorne]|nr:hypothetical protein HDU97_004420 [Phlyctochytrium planicorne]
MILTRIVAVATLIASAVSAGKLSIRAPGPNVVKNAYLVEMPKGVDSEAQVKNYLTSSGFNAEDIFIRGKISTDLFNGVSFFTTKEHSEDVIANISDAVAVHRVHTIRVAEPLVGSADESVNRQFAPESIHTLTGVNDARNKFGLTGKGIKVAVIDSGVDYYHEALGGGFGPGFKVAFGYDFVGDKYNAENPFPEPDNDPLDQCSTNSHGTHVSGIVAADALNLTKPEWVTQIPFTGVAPGATLGAYRVFGCEGQTEDDIVAMAIYKAAEDGADIINLSLGGGPTFNDGPDADAATRVGAKGSFVFASHGNNGATGAMIGGSPGISPGGMGSASFDNLGVPKPFFEFAGKQLGFNGGGSNNNWDITKAYDVVANDLTADDKDVQDDGLGAMNPAIAGKTALIRWSAKGGSNARCTAAAKAGAIACILYANTDSVPNIAGSALIPSMAISHVDGQAIVAQLKTGSAANIKVSDKLAVFGLPTAGTVSDFSSPGLDQELAIKPDLGGIGGQVFSTVAKHIQVKNKLRSPYDTYSGTSMASPYSAGVAALILESFGRNRPTFDELRTLLQNTANFAQKYGTSMVESVAYQGAGLINAYRAVTSKTTVYPSRIALNDTQYTKQHYELTVTNKNTIPVTYTVKHVPALQVSPFQAGDDATLSALDQAYTGDYATVKFSKNNDRVDTLEFTLKAGASKSFNVHVQAPSTAIAGNFPIYSGYIVVDVDGDKVASVPYAGVVGRLRDAPIFVRKSAKYDEFFRSIAPAVKGLGYTVAANATLNTAIYDPKENFVRPVPEGAKYNLTESPLVFIPVLATTCRSVRIEAVFKGTDRSALEKAGIQRFTQLHLVGKATLLNPTGVVLPASSEQAASLAPKPRNSYAVASSVSRPRFFEWTGGVVTNSTDPNAITQALPAGKYQIRFAGIKHFGRMDAPIGGTDYDTVYSNTFEIVY